MCMYISFELRMDLLLLFRVCLFFVVVFLFFFGGGGSFSLAHFFVCFMWVVF